MSDNLKRKGPEDPNYINVHESWELEYWSNHFGVTKDQVKAAVIAVGTSVAKVRGHLRKK